MLFSQYLNSELNGAIFRVVEHEDSLYRVMYNYVSDQPDGLCIGYIEGYTKDDKDTIYRIEHIYDEGLLMDIKGCNFLKIGEISSN